ncbi:SpoIIE family protein phosphatase [Kineococcus sp. SYSU DK006]|uniref:PP2C family protein-serine/threonine phosphatase n=1 Tax=Kineococcus sp. SYSU DK006 TaxID=3383127 RepID=UPI003D7E27BC
MSRHAPREHGTGAAAAPGTAPAELVVLPEGTRPGWEAWDRAPCGLLVADAEGTVVEANRTLLAWTGRSRQEVVGRVRVGDLLSIGGRIYWETHLFPLVQVEGRAEEVAVELRAPGRRLPVLLSAVATGSGRAARVHVVLAAAPERARFERELVAARAEAERAATGLQALQHVSAALSRAVGVDAVAEALVHVVREQLGASGIDLQLDRSEQRPPGSPVRHRPPPAVVAPGAQHASVDGARARVPLQGQHRLQGVLTLTFPEGPGVDPPDLDVLTALGQQSGLALDRAWQHEQRAGIAHELQHSLLAGEVPEDPRYEVASAYLPGVEALEVGGDWYDVFRGGTPERPEVWLVVGDVVGHGLQAAVGMGQLRSALRAVSAPGAGPAEVLGALDRFVEQVEATRTATVALGRLELGTGLVRYACAGHLPPLLLPADGAPRLLWEGRSTPLGISGHDGGRAGSTVQLHPGDALLLYTDGLVERRRRPIDTGLDLLVSAAADLAGSSPQEGVEHLTRTLLADQDNDDDVCLLLLRWLGGPPTATASSQPGPREP